MFGIYNNMRKEFQFGICEETKDKAWNRLFEKIGKDAYKWRFEVRQIPCKKQDIDKFLKRGKYRERRY